MTRPKKPSMLSGTLDLIVLQLLDAQPTNGYDLAQRIQAVSRDVLAVNAGSLYPALYRQLQCLDEVGRIELGLPALLRDLRGIGFLCMHGADYAQHDELEQVLTSHHGE